MDIGVIQNLKTFYRQHIVERMLFCLNSEKAYAIDLLGATNILAIAWNSIKPEVIANCFRRCGFGDPAASGHVEEAAQILSGDNCMPESISGILPDGVTFEDYVQVASDVETCGVMTGAEIIQDLCPQQATFDDPSALSGKHSDASDA